MNNDNQDIPDSEPLTPERLEQIVGGNEREFLGSVATFLANAVGQVTSVHRDLLLHAATLYDKKAGNVHPKLATKHKCLADLIRATVAYADRVSEINTDAKVRQSLLQD